VAQDLLRMVTPPATVQTEPAEAPVPQVAATDLPKVDPNLLYGNWTATRDGGAKFSLVLDKENNFKWVYAEGNQPATQFEGKYTMEGNVLALERKDGGSLIAQVTPEADGKFNFRLVGAPKEDSGLTFVR